jgi:hypothetical protein
MGLRPHILRRQARQGARRRAGSRLDRCRHEERLEQDISVWKQVKTYSARPTMRQSGNQPREGSPVRWAYIFDMVTGDGQRTLCVRRSKDRGQYKILQLVVGKQ